MGLEEHLLTMFREDFEFHDAAGPAITAAKAWRGWACGSRGPAPGPPRDISAKMKPEPEIPGVTPSGEVVWLPDAERELKKIPFFVRGKARRNTEKYAADRA
jgi:light-independent protochlorophyllide reductase subunit B